MGEHSARPPTSNMRKCKNRLLLQLKQLRTGFLESPLSGPGTLQFTGQVTSYMTTKKRKEFPLDAIILCKKHAYSGCYFLK